MDGLQNYFEKMGSNFMVAAFIPSLAFVTLALLVFTPILPPALATDLLGEGNALLQSSLLTLVLSVIIGFILTSLNVFIYKLFEGYIFLDKLSFLRKNKVREARKIKKQESSILKRISILKKRYINLNSRIESSIKNEKVKEIQRKKLANLFMQLEALYDEFETIHADYDSKYPPIEKYILPTRFGNILRAAETYSETRYQIDGVPMWTRIIKVIDKEYMGYIDTANNQCSFLLYCSLLSIIFSFLSLTAIAYQMFLKQQLQLGSEYWLYFIPLADKTEIYDHRIGVYLFITFLALVASWFFYKASLWNVDQYGDIIRSTYDLYRFDLLEALKIEAPSNHKVEKDTWRNVSQFITIGEAAGKIELNYQVHSEENGAG